jgi:hypothetical protein
VTIDLNVEQPAEEEGESGEEEIVGISGEEW